MADEVEIVVIQETNTILVSDKSEAHVGIDQSDPNIVEASATLAGSGNISGSLGALADAVATIGGTSSLSGDLRGVGHMTADILPYTDLSPQALAAAVWGSLAAQFNSSGTMGEKLNASGSSGDPWTADLSGYNTDGTAGKRMKETLTKIQFLALK